MLECQLEKIIKNLSKGQGISIRQLCLKIEMTESGFSQALKNNTLKIETLKKIANVLGVEITMFFAPDKGKEEDQKAESTSLQKKIKELEKNIPVYEMKMLESEINKNGRKGKGLCYLEWDIVDGSFITSFKELNEPFTAEDYKKIMSKKDQL